ncbi:hypothetical protein LLE49_11205 [Alicyclobacillus tolerans]|uniref:hypothetical protein n=1 Tax=Alicyclobacillus tolerans TaxID=90970 RepID=UPI001F1B9C02|nr:hypothetical protein [Alicyclobacillus tolerans]MCF8565283.1 hypothetical protein [Alicyclobacillus tolerans]
MRHLQKMQIGMAVSALMLCMTSLVPVKQQVSRTTAEASLDSVQVLSAACHVDAFKDDRIQVLKYSSSAKLPIVSVARDSSKYHSIAESINQAIAVPEKPELLKLNLLFLRRGNVPDFKLAVTASGLLRDERTGKTFSADSRFMTFIRPYLSSPARQEVGG